MIKIERDFIRARMMILMNGVLPGGYIYYLNFPGQDKLIVGTS